MRVHLRQSHNNASEWRSKTQFSVAVPSLPLSSSRRRPGFHRRSLANRREPGFLRDDKGYGVLGAEQAYNHPMPTLAIIALILATVVAMEFVAWASHKYVMHGFGWAWHRDHHEPHDKALEKNDLFAIVGAAMSISMFALGSPMIMGASAWEPGTWSGLGILFYGIIYTLVHAGPGEQRTVRWWPRSG